MLPMSVETMTSAGIAFSSSRKTWRGCSSPSPASFIIWRLHSSFSWIHSSSSFSHAAFSAWMVWPRSAVVESLSSVRSCSRSSSACAAALASPQIPTVISLTRPSILWSASTWIISASFGQYSMPYWGSVPKGPRRVPSASTTSALLISFIPAFDPW